MTNPTATRKDAGFSEALFSMKKLSFLSATAACALMLTGLSGCETPTRGALTGAGVGGVIGGLAGRNLGSAAIGAGAGALTGAAIGEINKERRHGYRY